MEQTVHVEFTVTDRDKFDAWLKLVTEGAGPRAGKSLSDLRIASKELSSPGNLIDLPVMTSIVDRAISVIDDFIIRVPVIGYRSDDTVQRRESLQKFVDAMEVKLRKNDHKTNWREQPLQALVRLAKLEVAEFDVSLEFFSAAEARSECVDVANFFLILYDRLGMLDQDKLAGVKP